MRSPWLLALALSAVGCGGAAIGSIGAMLGRDRETGAVVVRGVPEGHAAERAGLRPGDELVFVEGHDVRELSVEKLRQLLRGEPGSEVSLTLLREGEVVRVRLKRTPLRSVEPARPQEEPVPE